MPFSLKTFLLFFALTFPDSPNTAQWKARNFSLKFIVSFPLLFFEWEKNQQKTTALQKLLSSILQKIFLLLWQLLLRLHRFIEMLQSICFIATKYLTTTTATHCQFIWFDCPIVDLSPSIGCFFVCECENIVAFFLTLSQFSLSSKLISFQLCLAFFAFSPFYRHLMSVFRRFKDAEDDLFVLIDQQLH